MVVMVCLGIVIMDVIVSVAILPSNEGRKGTECKQFRRHLFCLICKAILILNLSVF